MFLRPNRRTKDGKDHTYWSLVETVRTADGPRQKMLCYLGELNDSSQARWLKTIEVFNEQGEAQQLKLFPSHVEPPADDPQVARVLLNRVRLERTRQFGACYLGLELWKRLQLDRFFESAVDSHHADVPWSRVAAVLAINRLCAPGSELAIEERWYPSKSAGIHRPPSMICWGSKKARSTTRVCIAAWIAFCRRRASSSSISNNDTESCSEPSLTSCSTT
ncbi:MAG TPA: hypothetical protein VNV86_05085 [Candidatus Acidoferrum sp.]|nr:hypothetical protein [Candidatus Acidoferrum sp.]